VNKSNWCYASLEKLNTLGLLAGGMDNNYEFNMSAKAEDLASLLLNGIYRLSPEKYSLEVDNSLRQYFVKDQLTKSKAAEILDKLNNIKVSNKNAYETACKKGFFDDLMQAGMKNKEVLRIDDVIYLAAYNIEKFTGKEILG
jgi:hypothetical protein